MWIRVGVTSNLLTAEKHWDKRCITIKNMKGAGPFSSREEALKKKEEFITSSDQKIETDHSWDEENDTAQEWYVYYFEHYGCV